MQEWEDGNMPGMPVSSSEPSGAANAAASPAAIGVVGGGQLALMLAEAAEAIGISVHVQTPSAHDPAVSCAGSLVQADLGDARATAELARRCQAITFENEWLNLSALQGLAASGVRFVPSLEALEPLLSKRRQRALLEQLRLPSPRWCDLPLRGETLPAWMGFPLMAKADSGGYDGKGTALIHNRSDLAALVRRIGAAEWYLEELVAFDHELAITVARDSSGQVEVWPLALTHQHRQVCDWVVTPAPVSHAVQAFARNIARSLVTALDYVGVLTVELFYGPAGLQVNEIAPRTHNSAHITIETSHTSQFTQQARIVAGWPLANPAPKLSGGLMLNLLGYQNDNDDNLEPRQALAALPGARVHWYGKAGPSLGRKLGHVTLPLEQTSPEARMEEAGELIRRVRSIWPLPPDSL
jgi:5-(carboxyamino)imidazole ribonucleotide synthase